VVVGEDEDLRLARQATEGRGVEDAVAVALEAGPPLVGFLGPGAVAAAHGQRGARRQRRRLMILPGSAVQARTVDGGARIGVGHPHPGALRAVHGRGPALGAILHRCVGHEGEPTEGVSSP
jgi:hypothetical protein